MYFHRNLVRFAYNKKVNQNYTPLYHRCILWPHVEELRRAPGRSRPTAGGRGHVQLRTQIARVRCVLSVSVSPDWDSGARLASPLGTLEDHHGLLCHSFTQVRVFKEMYIWIELNWRDSYIQTVVAVRRSIVISFYYVSTETHSLTHCLLIVNLTCSCCPESIMGNFLSTTNSLQCLKIWTRWNECRRLFIICYLRPTYSPTIWLSLWQVCGCYSMGFLSIHSRGAYVCPVT